MTNLNSVAKGEEHGYINKGHDVRDLDFDRNSYHHTLGLKQNQAAPGDVVQQLLDKVAELETRIEALEP